MSDNHFRFKTEWRVEGSLEEIVEILENGADFERWWPAVYLDIQEVEPGGPDAVGRVLNLYTKGWLPYTLRWQARVTENKHPYGYSLSAAGDLAGHGVWEFAQAGPDVVVTYEWTVDVEQAWMRRLAFLFRPLYAANHNWAMRQGEKSLRLELQRRHARTEAERVAVPLPPGPTFAFAVRQK